MDDSRKALIRRALASGWRRTTALAVAGTVLYLPYVTMADASANTAMGGVLRAMGGAGLILLALALGERIRRLIRPYVNLAELVELAKGGNVGAGIVALGAMLADVLTLWAFVNIFMFR